MITKNRFFTIAMSLLLAQVFGCAALMPKPVIQSGEKIKLEYNCFNEKQLAITTDLERADHAKDKMDYFISPIEPGAVEMTAGLEKLDFWNDVGLAVDFIEGVNAELAKAMVGRPYGKANSIKITGGVWKKIPDSERFLRLNRVSGFDCQGTTSRLGTKLTVGEVYKAGDRFPAKDFPGMTILIKEVREKDVDVELLFESGMTLDHPFGKIRFTKNADGTCSKIYDSRVGHFIRSGPLVGRVFKIDDAAIHVDFGESLAGQTLSCDVNAIPAAEGTTTAKQ